MMDIKKAEEINERTNKIIDHYCDNIDRLRDVGKKDEADQLDNEYRQLMLPYVDKSGRLMCKHPLSILGYRVGGLFKDPNKYPEFARKLQKGRKDMEAFKKKL